ncbi:MAG: lysophospholipid acyltransferase family protein [Verrucomicrobiota bacterium]|nr:lysophospholipid acyltransferase family protein [Verrucomicrobiota bacterium]
MKIEGWRARWLIAFGFRLLQLWARTIRYQLDDRAGVVGTSPNERYIGALWHNRLLLLPFVIQRFLPERHGAALISASRDGTLLADLVERFGFEVVRGSSSRKGATAMLQLAEVIASGKDVVITPDGPRGPAYELGPGIIFLAQKSGVAVVPVNMEYSSCWRLKSWDRFILPRPFSRVRVILGLPHWVAPTSTDEASERERVRLQDAMMRLVERR